MDTPLSLPTISSRENIIEKEADELTKVKLRQDVVILQHIQELALEENEHYDPMIESLDDLEIYESPNMVTGITSHFSVDVKTGCTQEWLTPRVICLTNCTFLGSGTLPKCQQVMYPIQTLICTSLYLKPVLTRKKYYSNVVYLSGTQTSPCI